MVRFGFRHPVQSNSFIFVDSEFGLSFTLLNFICQNNKPFVKLHQFFYTKIKLLILFFFSLDNSWIVFWIEMLNLFGNFFFILKYFQNCPSDGVSPKKFQIQIQMKMIVQWFCRFIFYQFIVFPIFFHWKFRSIPVVNGTCLSASNIII